MGIPESSLLALVAGAEAATGSDGSDMTDDRDVCTKAAEEGGRRGARAFPTATNRGLCCEETVRAKHRIDVIVERLPKCRSRQ